MTCSIPGCPKPVEKGGLCAGHRKRMQRNKAQGPLRPRGGTWWEPIARAAQRRENATTVTEKRNAEDALRQAIRRYIFGPLVSRTTVRQHRRRQTVVRTFTQRRRRKP